MDIKNSNQIRKLFIDYFKNLQHKHFESSPVVPYDDPTLLFTNAGMNQFKKIFLGEVKNDLKRAVSAQKCIRVSGKHNDLEEVGKDGRHHTFFEMLGNWSFGDYFKDETISWSWDFITNVLKLDISKLYVSVYKDDKESYDIWKNKIGLSDDRIAKLGDIENGDEENFWSMGDTGPCGACTEIFYDQGEDYSCGSPDCAVGCDCDRYLEVWNLVFMEFNRDDKGKLTPLPFKSVDTGMGFERIVAIIQGVESNYDTDIFQCIARDIEKISNKKYIDYKVPFQIIMDHIRTIVFSIADGVIPSNEGRGYVIRRILRRAARQSRKLEIEDEFLYKLVNTVVDKMGDYYPEIRNNKEKIVTIIKEEEIRFNKTLDKGLKIYKKIINNSENKTIAGKDAFLLHDTYGFPLDMTIQMANEDGYIVNEDDFKQYMEKQREASRNIGKNVDFSSILGDDWTIFEKEQSEFTGYEKTVDIGKVYSFVENEENDFLFLNKTPFYAQSGGQIYDRGIIVLSTNDNIKTKVNEIFKKHKYDITDISIYDTEEDRTNDYLKNIAEKINSIIEEIDEDYSILFVNAVHKTNYGPMHSYEIKYGKKLKQYNSEEIFANCFVDNNRRKSIMRNHTVTHILHSALYEYLGDHIKQAGSFVSPDYLRFDFNHNKTISSDVLNQIEEKVNDVITTDLNVEVYVDVEIDKAKEMGAKALFEDKYSDKVRVIKIPGYSTELCGGTHAPSTGFIQQFIINKEEAASAGVRRIEAVTGNIAYKQYQKKKETLIEAMKELKVPNESDIRDKIHKLNLLNKSLQEEIEGFKQKDILDKFANILENSFKIKQYNVYGFIFENSDIKQLRDKIDQVKQKDDKAIVIFANESKGKLQLVCGVSKGIAKEASARNILSSLAKDVGGSAGGRDDFAQGGAKDAKGLRDILSSEEKLEKYI